MAERVIPWWRKALDYAISGIRSLLRSGRTNGGVARETPTDDEKEKPEVHGSVKEAKPDIVLTEAAEVAPAAVEETDAAPDITAEVPTEFENEAEVAAVTEIYEEEPSGTESHDQNDQDDRFDSLPEPVQPVSGEALISSSETERAEFTTDKVNDAVPAAEPTDSPDASPLAHESEPEADVPAEPTQEMIAEVRAMLEAVDAVEAETVLAPAVLAMTVAEIAPEAISALEMIELAVEKTKREAMGVEAEITPSVEAEQPLSVEVIEAVAENAAAPAIVGDGEPEIAPAVEVEEAPAETQASEEPETVAETKAAPEPEALEESLPVEAETAQESDRGVAIAIPVEASISNPEAQPAEPKLAVEKTEAQQKTAARVAAAVKAREESPDASPFSIFLGQVYEGPLDLLLDLIRKQDIDIYDIPIAKITAQFLAYVNQLKAGDMDVAGEFIYTASLLIHIKSKMLLPRTVLGPEDAAEDPRRELVERLLEHERFKNAAQMLQQKQMLEAATWTNPGVREFREDAGAEPEIAADTTDLVRIFREILERARNRPIINVEEDSVTVGQMIQFLVRRLTMEGKPVALRKLLSHTRSERALIAMFLALLELVRLQAILLRQDRQFSEIFVKKHSGFEAVIDQGLASARDDWR